MRALQQEEGREISRGVSGLRPGAAGKDQGWTEEATGQRGCDERDSLGAVAWFDGDQAAGRLRRVRSGLSRDTFSPCDVRNASGSGALQPQGRVLEALPQKRARF